MGTFYFAAIFSTCLMAFMNFAQPFVLTEVLHVPLGEQGSASGTLATLPPGKNLSAGLTTLSCHYYTSGQVS